MRAFRSLLKTYWSTRCTPLCKHWSLKMSPFHKMVLPHIYRKINNKHGYENIQYYNISFNTQKTAFQETLKLLWSKNESIFHFHFMIFRFNSCMFGAWYLKQHNVFVILPSICVAEVAYLSSNNRKKQFINNNCSSYTYNKCDNYSENEFRMSVWAAKYKWALLYLRRTRKSPQNHSDTVIVFIKSASIQSRESVEQL